MGRRFVFTPPKSKQDKPKRIVATGPSPTKEEEERNELLRFMPKGTRKEYEKADHDQKKSIWEANKQAYEASHKRKEQRLLRQQERTAKVLDMLQRVKEDPSQAHRLPPDDA